MLRKYEHRKPVKDIFFMAVAVIMALAPLLPAASPAQAAAPIPDLAAKQPTAGTAPSVAPAAQAPAPSTASRAAPNGTMPAPVAAVSPTGQGSAFVRDVDLGNGERAAIISSSPLSYRAADGTWQPIDPRFEPSDGGFSGARNVPEIRLPARQAAPRLRLDGAEIGWEPRDLVLTADGKDTVLARPLNPVLANAGSLSADGLTVTYRDNWTLPGLADEVAARAGAVEQSLVFTARPPALTGELTGTLTLRALLHLPPGVQPFINGAAETGEFETDGPIELRDAQGSLRLALTPARVYAQGTSSSERGPDSPSAITAHYRLRPYDAESWLVSMETPLAWWADPARRYPVVFDPALAIIQPTEVAQVRAINAPPPLDQLCYTDPGSVGVGIAGACGESRALIRFNNLTQLSFPPNYQILRAQFVAGATGGTYKTQPDIPGMVRAELLRITEPWNPASVGYPGPATGEQLCSFLKFYSWPPGSPFAGHSTDFCDISIPVVQEWLRGVNNNGVMLRMQDCDLGGCLVTFPRASSWTSKPRGGLIYDYALDGQGFALVIHYKGPELQNGQVTTVNLPTQPAQSYLRTYHTYRVGASVVNNHTWEAVAVKSLRNDSFDGQPIEVAAGQMTMSDACNGIDLICTEGLAPGGQGDQSNFIVGTNVYGAGNELRVYPLSPDIRADSYEIEAVGSVDAPPFPGEDFGDGVVAGTGVISLTFNMSTSEILRLFNLNVQENRRLLVQVDLDKHYMPINVHLFKPRGSSFPYAKRESQNIATNNGSKVRTINQGEGGAWGLAVEYPSDPVYEIEGALITDITVTVTIRSCPLEAYPEADGCYFMQKPNLDPGAGPVTPSRSLGSYVVYSESGFEGCPAQPLTNCEQSVRPAAGKKYMPWVTWNGATSRMVGFAGAPIQVWYNQAGRREITGSYLGRVLLALDPPGYVTKTLDMWTGGFIAVPGGDPARSYFDGFLYRGYYGEPDCYDECSNVLFPTQTSDPNVLSLKERIDVRQGGGFGQHAVGLADIQRPVQLSDGSIYQYKFHVEWSIDVETSSEGALAPYNVQVTRTDGGPLGGIMIAGLSLTWPADPAKWSMDFDAGQQKFTWLRARDTIVQQPAQLGAAWNYAQGVILPAGVAPGGGAGACPGFCVTVRGTDGGADWKMPDVNINQLPQTMLISSPGQLQVFSSDHPGAVQNTDLGFSYKGYGARVEIYDGVCPGGGNQITSIVKGSMNMALPGIDPKSSGDPGSSAAPEINATFVLCENSLHQVSLTFTYPPGIPIAQPPSLYVNLIGGTVTIAPDHVVIVLQIGFFIGAAAPQLFKGTATLTLDTRGLFDMQAKGRIMGLADGEGHLWVAWNPLDLGAGVQGWVPNQDDWVLHGFIYAHVWRGSGWQNRYPWLAGNDDFHLTASYQAEFRIKEGAIIDEWPIVIPPDDFTIGVELSFGQFCTNDSCTSYQWGIKGKVRVFGVSVGIYVNLECKYLLVAVVAPPAILLCTDFILGSDDHILIDQYGGGGPPFPLAGQGGPPSAPAATDRATVHSSGQAVELNRRTVANPDAPQVDEPLNVKSTTTSFLAAFGWARGKPRLALVRPDGVTITAQNAATYGVAVSTTANSLLFGVPDPMPGQWIARITNATSSDDYRLMYFANKDAPELAFTAPVADRTINATGDSTTAQPYRIQWTPPADAANLRLGLYYSATVASALTTTQQYGGTIIENLDPAQGYFDWDLSFLATGDYHIYATLQDKAGARVTMTGTNQYVGVTPSIAPGVVHYMDQVAPPPIDASGVIYTPKDGGMLMCWPVSPAHDLASYRVSYRIFDGFRGGPFGFTTGEAVLATVPYAPGARQCTRLTGLNAGATITFIGAGIATVDASGNVSGRATPGNKVVQTAEEPQLQPLPLTGTRNSDASVTLTWPYTLATHYELFYAREAWAGPFQPASGADEGPSPISLVDIMYTGSYTLHGLSHGYWYAFAVRWYGSNPYAGPSPLSRQVWLLVTDGLDRDHDGIPDDWERVHGINDPNADPDGDGLTNRGEAGHGTNPILPDTDGDGWTDGEEVHYGTDPLDPSSHPMGTPDSPAQPLPLPRLSPATDHLSFHAFTRGPDPAPQTVQIAHPVSGTLTLSATSDAAWAVPKIANGNLVVTIRKSGLRAGHYTGHITVRAAQPGTISSPARVTVDLELLAGNEKNTGGPLWLPWMGKRAPR